MTRITVIANELRGFSPVGGMGTATTFLALALARMNHDVEILVGAHHRREAIDPYWQNAYDAAGIAIRGAPAVDASIAPWPLARACSIEDGLREKSGDVVVAHEFGAPAYTALRMKHVGLAFVDTLFVVFCHGSRRYALDLSPVLAPPDLVDILGIGVLEQACVELADVVVSPSAYLLDWMRESGWRLPERSLVIPYFARSDVLDEPSATVGGVSTGAVERLTFFGRVDERKGLTLFTDALNALEPSLLGGLDVEFIGRTTPTWPAERVEGSLSAQTRSALRRIVFENNLDQHDALARLRRPGTLVVMPSLSETFSNTVYECLENSIPFIASNVGGVPELVAREDHARVLFDATPEGVAAALRRTLSDGRVPAPARPAFDRRIAFERWAEVVALRPQPRATTGEDADVVTGGIHTPDGTELYLGDPGGLGVLANTYGAAARFRGDPRAEATLPWEALRDGDWPRLARAVVDGARVVSIPRALVDRADSLGTIQRDPQDALLAVQQLERALPDFAAGMARLAGGLAAEAAQNLDRSPPQPRPRIWRALASWGAASIDACHRLRKNS